jgi:hypothetical protein
MSKIKAFEEIIYEDLKLGDLELHLDRPAKNHT